MLLQPVATVVKGCCNEVATVGEDAVAMKLPLQEEDAAALKWHCSQRLLQ